MISSVCLSVREGEEQGDVLGEEVGEVLGDEVGDVLGEEVGDVLGDVCGDAGSEKGSPPAGEVAGVRSFGDKTENGDLEWVGVGQYSSSSSSPSSSSELLLLLSLSAESSEIVWSSSITRLSVCLSLCLSP
eukprot:sb/3475068/